MSELAGLADEFREVLRAQAGVPEALEKLLLLVDTLELRIHFLELDVKELKGE